MTEQGARTKQKYFDAAAALFSMRDYEDVTTRDITSGGGTTEGALYRHYSSKKVLLYNIYDTFQHKLKKFILLKTQIDQYIHTNTPRSLLMHCMQPFSGEDQIFMIQAYRIVHQRQMVDPMAENLLLFQFHRPTAEGIKYVLECVIERDVIPTVDTTQLSQLFAHVRSSATAIYVSCYRNNGIVSDQAEIDYEVACRQVVEVALGAENFFCEAGM